MSKKRFKRGMGVLKSILPSARSSKAARDKNRLKILYDLFIKSNNELAISAVNTGDYEEILQSEDLIAARLSIVDMATAQRGYTLDDLTYKMALWRHMAANSEPTLKSKRAANMIAYSVFKDLVKMTGNQDMLTERDLRDAA